MKSSPQEYKLYCYQCGREIAKAKNKYGYMKDNYVRSLCKICFDIHYNIKYDAPVKNYEIIVIEDNV